MWIVRLALSRPYTFIVMALVVILLTPVVLLRTPTDIFPEINIPVISLVWKGLYAPEGPLSAMVRALGVRGDALLHLLRFQPGVVPDQADYGNVDFRKNVGGRAH